MRLHLSSGSMSACLLGAIQGQNPSRSFRAGRLMPHAVSVVRFVPVTLPPPVMRILTAQNHMSTTFFVYTVT